MSPDAPTLHSYWRSTAAYRVRIALAHKAVPFRQVTHDLRAGAQRTPGYRAVDPQGLVPALDIGGETLIQSGAILEWLEERYPAPALLPPDATARAVVRGMAGVIGCDIHPLNNLRVLTRLRGDLGADDAQVAAWMAHWLGEGFAALETLVARHGQGFCFGREVTLADCYLVPQMYAADRFAIDTAPFPHLRAAAEAARALPAFEQAHPDRQPDADRP